MNRVLNVEFPPLVLEASSIIPEGWQFITGAGSDYRAIEGYNDQIWVNESKLDLSGYVMDDLTVYFRNSFEQKAFTYDAEWEVDGTALTPFSAVVIEATILSSVPLDDTNLANSLTSSPGFISQGFLIGRMGNFNRTHIIHGTNIVHGLDTTFGSDLLSAAGSGFMRVIDASDYSSLEPTAADCIYCYRVFLLPNSYDRTTNVDALNVFRASAKRVILNAMTDKEPDLEYMMRLKRSYELANQV
jgi:hypothetical protein